MWLGLLGGLGLYLGVCFVLARSYLHPALEPLGPMPDGFAQAAHDELPKGTWVGGPDSPERVYLLVHGYGARQSFWNPLAGELSRRGHRVVVPPLPGHGLEGSPSTAFGIEEAKVVARTAKALRKLHPQSRIVLLGCSMGGAAGWLATEHAEGAVDAVASESAFARFDEAMAFWFERKLPGASITLRPVIWFASWMSGLTPSDNVPMEAAAKWRGKPALVIQAGADQLIGRSHADRLAEAAGCEMWIVPKARHARVQDVALEEYAARLESL